MLVSSCFWASLAFGGAPPPIVGGASTHDHPEVVLVVAENAQANLSATCTGTIVGDGAVLTAAHCVSEGSTNFAVANVYVLEVDASSEARGSNTTLASGWSVHPAYDPASGENDMAVVGFAQTSSTEPVALYAEAANREDIGRQYGIVGFGLTSETDGSTELRKRYAEVPLLDYDDAFLYTYDEEDGDNACSGDSGGPLFRLRARSGEYALAGVMNWVSGCTGGTLASGRLDEQVDWISALADVSVEDGYDDGAVEEGPDKRDDGEDAEEPEPGGCASAGASGSALASGIAAGLLRRRRQIP